MNGRRKKRGGRLKDYGEKNSRILNVDVKKREEREWNANWIMMMLITDLNSIMNIFKCYFVSPQHFVWLFSCFSSVSSTSIQCESCSCANLSLPLFMVFDFFILHFYKVCHVSQPDSIESRHHRSPDYWFVPTTSSRRGSQIETDPSLSEFVYESRTCFSFINRCGQCARIRCLEERIREIVRSTGAVFYDIESAIVPVRRLKCPDNIGQHIRIWISDRYIVNRGSRLVHDGRLNSFTQL